MSAHAGAPNSATMSARRARIGRLLPAQGYCGEDRQNRQNDSNQFLKSILRVAVELLVRQPDAADKRLIGPQDRERHAVVERAGERHHVVLIDAVAADAEPADQRARRPAGYVAIKRRASGEEDDAVLVGQVERVVEVGPWEERVVPLHAAEVRAGGQRRTNLPAGLEVGPTVGQDRERSWQV